MKASLVVWVTSLLSFMSIGVNPLECMMFTTLTVSPIFDLFTEFMDNKKKEYKSKVETETDSQQMDNN